MMRYLNSFFLQVYSADACCAAAVFPGSTAWLLCRQHRAPHAGSSLGQRQWGFLRVWAFPRGGRIRSNRAAGFEKSIKRLGKFPERNL
jgi:hypothetical protein